MELEESIKLLKEMQENCKNKTIYKDEKAEAKAEAIEVVLKEIEYLKKNQRLKKDFNGEKIFCLEYDKETLRDMVLEQQEEIKELKSNSISKNKIRELFAKHNINISEDEITVDGYNDLYFIDELKELLEEEE